MGVLRILPPDLENRIDFRIEEHGSRCVGDDLVDDTISQRIETGDLSARSGHPYADQIELGSPEVFEQRLETRPRRFDGIPICPKIDGVQNSMIFEPQNNRFCSGGPHIQTYEAPVVRLSLCVSDRVEGDR